MNVKPFSVTPVVFPTGLVSTNQETPIPGNVAGCENNLVSEFALEVVRRCTPALLTDHWDAQDIALRSKLATQHRVDTSQVFLTSGAYGAVMYVFDIFVSSNTRVGLLRPDWPGFNHHAERKLAPVNYLNSLRYPFSFGIDQIVDFLHREQIDFFIFSNPSATTGRLFSTKEIETLLKACPRTLIVNDEGDSISANSDSHLSSNFENLVTIRSFSKFYGLSGLRIGYVLSPAPFSEHFRNMLNPCEVCGISIMAASAVLDDNEYQTATQRRVSRNLALLSSACEDTPYRIVPGSQCFAAYLWADESVSDPSEAFSAHGIRLAPGSIFGLDRGGRINLASAENIDRVATAIGRIFGRDIPNPTATEACVEATS